MVQKVVMVPGRCWQILIVTEGATKNKASGFSSWVDIWFLVLQFWILLVEPRRYGLIPG
jgi:hypothetical protein